MATSNALFWVGTPVIVTLGGSCLSPQYGLGRQCFGYLRILCDVFRNAERDGAFCRRGDFCGVLLTPVHWCPIRNARPCSGDGEFDCMKSVTGSAKTTVTLNTPACGVVGTVISTLGRVMSTPTVCVLDAVLPLFVASTAASFGTCTCNTQAAGSGGVMVAV